ncbi:MAG: fibronectin type III domain-containing protein, partial [Lachnospiraceae bacterium]|nr:fibronectin type III domain-containing protein [Lachnospiraceae bacterium]
TAISDTAVSDTTATDDTIALPENITASVSGTSASVSWDYSNEEKISGFTIQAILNNNRETPEYEYTTEETHQDFSNLIPGKRYTFRVRAEIAPSDENSTAVYSEWSEDASVVPAPSTPELNADTAGFTSIKLDWKAGAGENDGFRIYRSTSADGSFKRIKTINSSETFTFTNTDLTPQKDYYYKIKSFSTAGDETCFSKASPAVKAVPVITTPVFDKIKFSGATGLKISWNKVPDVSGYAIYRSENKKSGFKRISTIEDADTVSCAVAGLENQKIYYFKIKAYYTKDGKNYYSNASAAKRKTMNNAGFKGESYESKCQRVFKTDHYKDYATSEEAAKDMKSITVETWDIDSSGEKYTRTFTIKVHKNIASTVVQIFKEIYNGDEKFPIHSIGGYSWRGDSSSSEHCEGVAIDINANENAMIQKSDGKVLAGKYYKPGEDPYSIPAGGDVVNACEKYGFEWGDWSKKVDYMHFSYFGT